MEFEEVEHLGLVVCIEAHVSDDVIGRETRCGLSDGFAFSDFAPTAEDATGSGGGEKVLPLFRSRRGGCVSLDEEDVLFH